LAEIVQGFGHSTGPPGRFRLRFRLWRRAWRQSAMPSLNRCAQPITRNSAEQDEQQQYGQAQESAGAAICNMLCRYDDVHVGQLVQLYTSCKRNITPGEKIGYVP